MSKKKVLLSEVQLLLSQLTEQLQGLQSTAAEGGDIHHLVIQQADDCYNLITGFLSKFNHKPFPDPTPEKHRPYLVHADAILAKEERARNISAANVFSKNPVPVETLSDIEHRMLLQAKLYAYVQRQVKLHDDIPTDDSAIEQYVELTAMSYPGYHSYCKFYPHSIISVLCDVAQDIIASRTNFKQLPLFNEK